MNRELIAKKVIEITRNRCYLDYNVISCGTNEIMQDSRLKEFTIIHKRDDKGIIIEYVKGKIFVSFFFNPKYEDKIDYSEILNTLPLRFKEIVAEIKKIKDSAISTNKLEEMLILALKGVPKSKFAFIDYIDSRYALLLFGIESLLNDSKRHTYFYINKPLFGKINTHFRASTKIRIKDIQEIIDAEK